MRILLIIVSCFLASASIAQEIALTFDDAPLGDGPVFSGTERAARIIGTLKKHNVDQAAFFVVTSHIDSTGLQRLKTYANAGHLLANHSHTHSWIRSIGTANYIRDIQTADSILKATVPYKTWYRYPFLDEGRRIGSRDSIRIALAGMSLMNAYVTVDNYDWHLAGALRKALLANKKVNYDLLKEVYLEHIWNSIQFYDNIGRQVLNRSPRHVFTSS
jgi:peptidoglycan-N-acetylglucosamine deacetylase